MKKRNKILLTMAILIIVISNTPPVALFFQESYSYQNKDGSFKYTEEPGKGLNYEVCQIRFERFKEQNLNNSNKTLFRAFSFKPWRFWEWWEMIINYKKFQLPLIGHSDHTS